MTSVVIYLNIHNTEKFIIKKANNARIKTHYEKAYSTIVETAIISNMQLCPFF